MDPPSVLNIHTPSSSFAIVHSLTQETLLDLYNKLSRKTSTDYYGARVGPGWLKYEYNDAVWNLDDDSDYAIFVWRRQQQQQQQEQERHQHQQNDYYISSVPQTPVASSSRIQLPPSPPSIAPPPPSSMPSSPTLHLHSPSAPLPSPPAYRNPAFYIFHPSRAAPPSAPPRRSPAPSHASTNGGRRSKKGREGENGEGEEGGGVPKFKKQFDRFHSENGVRTVMGQIGPVHNVRMLLKSGYRHVYISRKFAIKHGFIPADAAPGNYGYGGLVNIGSWPITLTPSSTQPSRPAQGYQRPDAFLTPAPSPVASPYSSPRTGGTALPSTGAAHHHHHHPSSASLLSAPAGPGAKSTRSSGNNNKSGSINGKRGAGTGNGRSGPEARGGNGHGTGAAGAGPKPVMVEVYLSEEPHFDVVLGRSFIEKRQIKMHSIDPTDVVCLDTGEKIECELVILKDGRGEIVTVT